MKFEKTTYVVGNLIPKLKKNISALIDVDYYQGGGIDVGNHDNVNFAKFENDTKGLGYDYHDDKYYDMNTMNLNFNMNIHPNNNHKHHNNYRSNKFLK